LFRPLIGPSASPSHPEDAFVAISYRKHWFYIDDLELRSKRTLSAVLFLLTLGEAGGGEHLPLLTIPAG
jgi:hypothetical protein